MRKQSALTGRERLNTVQLAIFTAPILGVEFIIYPTLAILPTFYASLNGGNLAAFGTALFISRSIYSWSGLLVGYLSDRIATRWGLRKPWMVVGLFVALVSVVLLFAPPVGAGPVYFTIASSLALASFSLIDIPYIAWGSEITRDPADRSRVASWRMGAANGALLLFLAIPYVPGFGGSSFLSPLVIGRLGIVAFVTVAVTVLLGVGFKNPNAVAVDTAAAKESLAALFRAVARNRPFRYVAAATFCSYIAFSIVLTLQLAFLTSVGLVKEYGLVVIVTTAVAVAVLPAWTALAVRIGKRASWLIGLAISILSAPLYFVLLPFTSQLVAIVVSGAVYGGASIVQFMPYSVVGDVIDYDRMRSRCSHAANYSAILLVLIRLTTAVGGAIAFYVLAVYHFKLGTVNAPAAQRGMLVVFFGLPALFNAFALVIAFFYPLSERRHAIVVERLARLRELQEM